MERHSLPPLQPSKGEDSQSLRSAVELPSTPAQMKRQSSCEEARTKADSLAALIAACWDRKNLKTNHSPF